MPQLQIIALTLLILIVSQVSLVFSVKKCCGVDEGLQKTNTSYICSKVEENISPLQFSSEISQFGNAGTCLDKTTDGKKIIKLFNEQEEKLFEKVFSFTKCCPINQQYDENTKKCVFNGYIQKTIFKNQNQFYDLQVLDSLDECIDARINYLKANFIENNKVLFVETGEKYFDLFENVFCVDVAANLNRIIVINSCKSNELIKCCANDEGLEKIVVNGTQTFNCSSNFDEYLLPLQMQSDVLISDDINGTCIDKLINEATVIEINKVENKLISEKQLPIVKKCCPFQMFYNETKKSCDFDENSDESLIQDSSANLYNLIIGAPDCGNKALVDYELEANFFISNGILILNNSIVFNQNTYCIDASRTKSKIILRTCESVNETCKQMTCIPKCCPSGKMFKIKNKKTVCVDSFDVPFQPNYTFVDGQSTPEKIAFIQRPVCKRGKYLEKTKFLIFPNGTLFYSIMMDPLSDIYCLENFDIPLVQQMAPVICYPPQKRQPENIYYFCGLIISIIFLAFTLITYFLLPELRNLHGRTVMNHTASLLVAFVIVAFVKQPTSKYKPLFCVILGYGILYSFLVAFSWLNVMCFDIWFTFGVIKGHGFHKKKELKKILYYCLYAYGMPLISTGITIYIDLFSDVPQMYKPNFGTKACWFDTEKKSTLIPYTIFFCIPIAILITCNIVFFVLTVRHCIKVRRDIQRMQQSDSQKKIRFFADKATLIMNLKLFMIMGISWIFELISIYVKDPKWLWQLLDTINVLQGLWIFCIFVLKSNVWKAIKKKLGYQNQREGSQTQSSLLSAKNSMVSNASLKANGISKPEHSSLIKKNSPNNKNVDNSAEK